MDDGITWVPLAGPLAGDATYGWTVPTADVTAARVRAEVLDVRGLTANASSVPFAIDSTPPTISSISPADGAADAEWTEPIIATFSEDVVGPLDAATIGIQTASGEWVTGAASWDSPSVFRFTPAAPLHASTAYIAHLNGTLRDLSDPGNALTAATWGFSTKANSGPTIRFRMILPAVLSGGSGWTLSWTSSDPDDLSGLLSVHLEYSDGGPFELIGGPLAPSGSLSWTVPAVDVANATLRVRVIDSQGGEANATVTFGIDATPPTIASASPPAGASNVPPNATVRITFSEPVDSGTASVGLRAVATGAWIPVTVAWVDALTMQLVPAILLREGRAYAVVLNGTLSDQSSPGNVLAPSSWTFRVAALPPSLTLVSPASGIRWTAGAPQTIRVRAADAQDATVTVSAAIATDGITFAPIMGSRSMAGGESTFPVTPPSVDAPSAVLRVCATDWDGASACSVLGLALDGTPPTIMETVPASGARRVLPDAAIVLTFSESMNRASVEDAIHIDPAVPVTFRWARGTFEDDTVFVDHARFAQTQTYTVIVRCDAADASAPGLPMRGACPLAITLTTASGPQVRITFPVGGERLTGGVDQKVRWIAGAEEPVVRAIAELSTDGGLSFPVSLSDAFVPTGETEVHATFPAIDTAAAVVRVNAIDSLGQITSAMSASFPPPMARPGFRSNRTSSWSSVSRWLRSRSIRRVWRRRRHSRVRGQRGRRRAPGSTPCGLCTRGSTTTSKRSRSTRCATRRAPGTP
ncbi:MAG: hypothetical protein E6K18_08620 [Methanobacteriota archaeon]|nr:MAG: hypothetical protein E6K18_08620 [Euryarchaeota archaeon]